MRLIRSVFGLKNDRKTQTTRRTRLCRRFSPSLELLEGRLVPAGTFHWTGAASDVWSLAANWNLTAGDGTFPGANGGTGDTAVFDGTPQRDAVLSQDATLDTLKIVAGYPKSLTVSAGKSLTVSNTFTMSGGTLNLGNGASLNLTSGLIDSWSGGDFSSTSAGGTVYVYNNAELQFYGDAKTLGANIVVGQDSGGVASVGTLDFAKNGNPTTNLNANVTLYNNANITNYAKGTINFYQTANSGTAGGIDMTPAGSTTKIDNYGTINRTVKDGGDAYLTIVPPTTGYAGSTLNLGKQCRILFTNKYNLKAGTFNKGDQSHITGLLANGGDMNLLDPGTPGMSRTYVDDALQWNGGNITFEQNTGGGTIELDVADDFLMNAGTMTELSGDLASPSGAYQQSNSTVTLNGGGISDSNGIQLLSGAVLNGPGSLLGNVSDGGQVNDTNGGTLAVTGSYTQTSAGATTVRGSTLSASSAVDVQGGTFTLAGTVVASAGMTIESGGTLYGNGTITVTGSLTNSGDINLAGGSGPGSTPGALVVSGDYTQTSGGELDVHLYSGGGYDTLQVSGQATLAGTLKVTSLGFTPMPGVVFKVVTYGSRSGTFDSISEPTLSFGHWSNRYDDPSYPDSLTLWVTAY